MSGFIVCLDDQPSNLRRVDRSGASLWPIALNEIYLCWPIVFVDRGTLLIIETILMLIPYRSIAIIRIEVIPCLCGPFAERAAADLLEGVSGPEISESIIEPRKCIARYRRSSITGS